jgi:hypothetical protein
MLEARCEMEGDSSVEGEMEASPEGEDIRPKAFVLVALVGKLDSRCSCFSTVGF